MKMKVRERVIFGLPTLLFCFAVIIMDSRGIIDVGKWGYSFIGAILMLLLNFYYRKATTEEAPVK